MGSNKNGKVVIICKNCDIEYKVKLSHGPRSKYCSKQCQAEDYKKRYLGKNNPNFNKNLDRDYDGYKLSYKVGRITLHKLITLEYLKLNSIPKGFNIHHRDCNINDNTPENLAVLNYSDHRWIHKQFGNACLWAYCHNKIDLESLCSWSTDPERAKQILTTSLTTQIGVFKSHELLENLEEDNQQLS